MNPPRTAPLPSTADVARARCRVAPLSRALGASLVLATALATSACGGSSAAPPTVTPKTSSTTTPTLRAQIAPTDDDAGGTSSEVFARAGDDMTTGKLAPARVLYDRVVAAERASLPAGAATSELGRAAAYNAGLCSEQLGDSKDARDRFRELASASPDTPEAIDANMRRGRLDVEVEDYDDLALAAASLLARKDVAVGDRVEGLALQAIALVASKDATGAEKDVLEGQKVVDAADDAHPLSPRNLAAFYFAKGELLRARGEAIELNPPGADFGTKLETRCQRLLDAEDAYVASIGTQEVDWAVRDGVRVAYLYTSLHDDLMTIQPPKQANTDARKALFRGAMHLRYRILLQKGLGTLEHTLNLEERTDVKTGWLQRARDAKATLDKELADEKAEIAKLPYSEAELQKALDDLSKPKSSP